MVRSDLLQTHEYGDLITHDSWRLQGIEISHTSGNRQRIRGWNTYIDSNTGQEVKVPESIDSSKTPFPPLILLVPPELLGTHEDTIGDPNNPQWVPEGHTESGFAEIDLTDGWNGSPVAVAAFAVCQGNEVMKKGVYEAIYQTMLANHGLGILDALAYGDLGILDGHHRVKTAIESTTQRLKYVPTQLIPYPYDPSVVLGTWHGDGNIWTAEQVFQCFKVPGNFADAKRTKFGIVGTDGITRRILDTQPNIRIPITNLI